MKEKENYIVVVDFLDHDEYMQLHHDVMAHDFQDAAKQGEEWGCHMYPDQYLRVATVHAVL